MGRLILKAYAILVVLGFMLAGLGECSKENPSPQKAWLPRIEQEADIRYKQGHRPNRAKQGYSKRPWENHKKNHTEEWGDFIEDLDNRGLDVWDPEAEDLWEEYY